MMADADNLPSALRTALERFAAESYKAVVSFAAPLEAQEPPSMIYHYTDDVGLRGILETGQLRLTDMFDLNDPSELEHGFSHAVRILNEKVAGEPNNSQIFARQFAATVPQGGLRASAHYFVCSFSSVGDDLGQWRAYADNGRGYALGFDAKVLETAFTTKGKKGRRIPNNTSFPVTYCDPQLISLHRQIVEGMFDLLSLPKGKSLERPVFLEYMSELGTYLTVAALHASVFFKHEAYNNEKEYRFLQIHRGDLPPPEVKLRSRPYSLIKYREFAWKKRAAAALRKIVIGPAADQNKAAQFARDCFNTFCPAGQVEIEHSRIPYRVP
jgi:Protein of unknown function (DUF2971)